MSASTPGSWHVVHPLYRTRMTRISGARRNRLVAVLLVALVAVSAATALSLRSRSDAAINADATLDQPIAASLEYIEDSLPNGLRYFILPNASSDDRAELRLVVDAGSVQETEEQRGLAHAVEHMVFRGTRTFPRGAIDSYFDAIGMRRGNDVNATTSLDVTEYRMTVPATRVGAVDTALAMLASMSHEATFDPEDARLESGVLLDEWRLSRGVDARLEYARQSLLHEGTPYASRPVPGDTTVLRRFDINALRDYYDSWYRPELMALVVVGDVDGEEIEEMITRHFGAIPARIPRRDRPTLPSAPTSTRALRASIIADPEARNSSISVLQPVPRQQYRTRADYRAGLIVLLWQDVLRGRLEDAALRPDSPLANIAVERRTLARSIGVDVVSVTAMKGETLEALEVTVAEMRAMAQSGPTVAELEERGRAMMRQLREQAQLRDGNAALAGEFVDRYLTGNAIFTSRTAYQLMRDMLPTITVEDVRAFARGRTADSGALVVVGVTADDTVARYTQDQIVTSTAGARAVSAVGTDDARGAVSLLARERTPGTIVAERAIPEIGTFDLTLSNGMRVLLKPSAFTFDEIQFRAVAPGGASLASDDEYASSYLADMIIDETGVGQIAAPRLRRWLASTSLLLAPYVSDDAIGLEGRTAPADLEAFFKLVHLHLAAPRYDTVAFNRYQARSVSLAQDRGRDPAVVFQDSVAMAYAAGDPRAIRNGAQFHLSTRLDDALEFWTQRTANASGFTVAIAGDFTLARVRPLIERYLASIPAGEPERPRDRGVSIPKGGHRRTFTSGIAGRARTAIGFTAPFDVTNENINALGAMREVVARALTDRLRGELGGTYHVDVSLELNVAPPSRYTITVQFEAAPERIEALANEATRQLQQLRLRGPTETQFQGVRETLVRDFDGRLEDNAYWVGELTFHARHGWPLRGILEHRGEAEALTLEELRRACAEFIAAGDFVRVTTRPR